VHLGLAGGLNLGRSKARGEFLVSLHDDTEIEAGWLEALLAAAVEDPAAGAVGSLVLDPDGSVQAAGRILWRDGRTSPVWPTGPGRRPPRREAFGARRPVDYADSSALLLRTAAFDAIGGADEDIHPAFYVDVDIAMGLRRLGYTIVVEPRSRCRHHRHGTTAGRSAYREFISERNRAHLRRKWATELEAYDPQARESPSAVARALTRAAEAARGATPRPLPVVAPPSFDLTARERRAEARDEALRSAWLAQLETALQAREADLDAITSTRWWRLYLKLLPLLSRLSPRAGRT
jgi:GT2 family glycosyltransferase